MSIDLMRYAPIARSAAIPVPEGQLVNAVGLVLEAKGCRASIGDLCEIGSPNSGPSVHAEVVGLRGEVLLLMPLGDTRHSKLRVSRRAFRAITEIHGEEALDVDGVRVELTLDNSLEGLSVIAESGASRVDGRVSERLAAVLRALEADHRRKAAGGDE